MITFHVKRSNTNGSSLWAIQTPTLKAVGSNPAGRTKEKPRNHNGCGVLLCPNMCGYVPSCAFEKVQNEVQKKPTPEGVGVYHFKSSSSRSSGGCASSSTT